MDTQQVLAIPGLAIGVKTVGQEDPEHPDSDLLEISGVPLYEDPDVNRVTSYAIALAATVKGTELVKK